jgi:hypothetical protein
MKHLIISEGSPYDHKKPLTCPHCIAILVQQRKQLCEKYEWEEWPKDLGHVYD